MRGRELAALYFYGFAAECFAKALVMSRKGSTMKGHDLMELMLSAGVGRQTLPSELRHAAETRDVSIRYQSTLPPGVTVETMEHMQRLAGWLRLRAERAIAKESTRGAGRRQGGR